MRISDWSSDVCSSDLLAQDSLQEGLGRTGVAGRIWRHRLDPDAALHLFRRNRARRLHPPAALRPVDGRAGDLHLRHAGAEGPLPAAHPVGRGLVVPGLFEIGRAHVRTPVTNAHLVCRLLLKTKTYY